MEGHGLFKGRRGGPLNSEQWGVTLLADYLLLHGEPVSSMPAGKGWESRLPVVPHAQGPGCPKRAQTLVYCMWN